MHIAFETNVGDDFLHDNTANSSGFGVPFNVVAALERLSHPAVTIPSVCVDKNASACSFVLPTPVYDVVGDVKGFFMQLTYTSSVASRERVKGAPRRGAFIEDP